MDEQYGYHADFLQDVPDGLKCAVCHLVMRQPVQIMACGHRFCKSCFQRIQGYAEHLSTPLLCPLDRNQIDSTKVFDDTAVSRDINNLEVKCSSSVKGCTWTGRLGSLQNHEVACVFNQNQLVAEQPDSEFMMKTINEVTSRLSKLEDMFSTKEKEISCLTNNMQQLNTRCSKQEKDLQDLKKENALLKLAITTNADSITKAEQQNLTAVGKQDLNETKFKQIFEAITLLKKNNPNHSERLTKIDEELKDVSLRLKRKVNDTTHQDRIKSLSTGLKEQYERLGKQSDSLEERCDKLSKRSDSLEEHMINIENIQFCSPLSTESKEILIQWKVTNFQSHIDKGLQVRSPIFFPCINGYDFQLLIGFSDEKIFLGLFMILHRNKTFEKQLKQYNIPYTLELLANDGSVKSRIYDETTFNNKKDWFEIPDGSECNDGCGSKKFLNLNDISKYMMNDTITFQCRFHLH